MNAKTGGNRSLWDAAALATATAVALLATGCGVVKAAASRFRPEASTTTAPTVAAATQNPALRSDRGGDGGITGIGCIPTGRDPGGAYMTACGAVGCSA